MSVFEVGASSSYECQLGEGKKLTQRSACESPNSHRVYSDQAASPSRLETISQFSRTSSTHSLNFSSLSPTSSTSVDCFKPLSSIHARWGGRLSASRVRFLGSRVFIHLDIKPGEVSVREDEKWWNLLDFNYWMLNKFESAMRKCRGELNSVWWIRGVSRDNYGDSNLMPRILYHIADQRIGMLYLMLGISFSFSFILCRDFWRSLLSFRHC